MKTKQPIQPIYLDELKTARFKPNVVVRRLLDESTSRGYSLNELRGEVDRDETLLDDYQHLMQLIGYSVDGYADLSTHSEEVLAAADARVAFLLEQERLAVILDAQL